MDSELEKYIRRSISDIARKCRVTDIIVIQKIKQILTIWIIMCWYGDINKLKIAEEDIPIYKVMVIKHDENEHFISFFREAVYKKNALMTSKIACDSFGFVQKALHSYSIKNTLADTDTYILGKDRYDTIIISSLRGDMVESYDGLVKYGRLKLILGYIPKGSRYCENDYGEIVSNQLVMTKICSEKELRELSK